MDSKVQLTKTSKKLAQVNKLLYKHQETINQFLGKFILCELCYKDLLYNYLTEKGKPNDKRTLNIDMRQVKPVAKLFALPMSKERLSVLFGSLETRGNQSAKKLRNSIMHSINQPAIEEIVNRKDELFEVLDEFIEIFSGENK